jgi:hypothetical protein
MSDKEQSDIQHNGNDVNGKVTTLDIGFIYHFI